MLGVAVLPHRNTSPIDSLLPLSSNFQLLTLSFFTATFIYSFSLRNSGDIMGEIGLLLAEARDELSKLAKELATRKYTDGELFKEVEGMLGHFGALIMKMSAKGLINEEVAEELLQLKEAK